ncbi:MAG: polysaccharide deacetylase family protein [Coprobacillaceae bacterium]
MKNIKKIILAILVSYLVIGIVWIGKIYIVHQLHINDLPVLGYHSVVSDEEKEKHHHNNPYVMSISSFEEQMQYLYDNQYRTLTMDEVYSYYVGENELVKPSVVLTFDDGFQNFNTVVKPILEKYDFQATAFVIGNKVTKNNKQNALLPYLQSNELNNDKYVSYYSHSYDLHHFAKIPYHKLIETSTLEEIQKILRIIKVLLILHTSHIPMVSVVIML